MARLRRIIFIFVILFIITVSLTAAKRLSDVKKYFRNEIRRKLVKVYTNFKKKTIFYVVFYDFSELKPKPKRVALFKKFANVIKKYPYWESFKLLIEGYTDSIPVQLASTKKNYPNLLAYSLGRAVKVKELFVKWGFKADNITTKGFADAKSELVEITKKQAQADTLTRLEQLQIEVEGQSIQKIRRFSGRRVVVVLNMAPGVRTISTATTTTTTTTYDRNNPSNTRTRTRVESTQPSNSTNSRNR